MMNRLCAYALVAGLALAGSCHAAGDSLTAGLKEGDVALKSAGPLAFGPQGILFVGDPQAATIHAIDTNDRDATAGKGKPAVTGIDEKVASLLGTDAKDIAIKDMAVNPISGNTYLSVSRGKGPKAAAVILKVTPTGKISELGLKKVKTSSAPIANAVEGRKRQEAITHIGYVNGRVLVAGLSNEEFASRLRSIPFPFDKTNKGTGIEIFHGAHGKFETHSPIRVFTTYKIGSEDNVLAAYTCTPLVKMPLSSLKPGEKIKAVTVAELGNRNRPLSMIVYKKDGKDYVLMANNARGLMKIGLDGIAKAESITNPVKGGKTAGLKYETIKGRKGVMKLDAFGKDQAVLLVSNGGKTSLETIDLP